MKIFLFIISLLTVAACSSHNATTAGESQPATAVANISFEADSAYHYVRQQCDFGPRVPGTPAHEQCARWLRSTLEQWCDTLVVQRAQVTAFDGTRLDIQNIVGSFNLSATDRVLLLAHWDCRPWADNDPDPDRRRQPVMGANDAASGVAVLLELARQLASSRPQVGVDLLLVDAEDWGDDGDEDSWALGTQYWADNPHVAGYRANFGILLDMVGARDARFTHEYFSRQYAQGVVSLVWQAARASGNGGFFPDQPGGAITDDHVVVNRRAGIPCIDIIDMRPGGETGFFAGWHTTHDTIDQIDPATLKAVGQTLAGLIYNW